MTFLRRLFGGGSGDDGDHGGAAEPADSTALEAAERARELELARFDQDRIDDLVRRQQRYADRSWTPPAQGGERRADDTDRSEPTGDR
jgi:hypothetical protein